MIFTDLPVPDILNGPEWKGKIKLLFFMHTTKGAISTIESSEELLAFLSHVPTGWLHPFVSWEVKPSGAILFLSTIKKDERVYYSNPILPERTANPIQPAAFKTIHGYRDVRSAQANDQSNFLDDEKDY